MKKKKEKLNFGSIFNLSINSLVVSFIDKLHKKNDREHHTNI